MIDWFCLCDEGTGRYSKCFKAVNKRTRRRVLGEEDSSPSGDDGIDHDAGDDEGDQHACEEVQAKTAAVSKKKSSWRGSFLRRRKKKKKKKKLKSKGEAVGSGETVGMERSSFGMGGGKSGTADDTTSPRGEIGAYMDVGTAVYSLCSACALC